jgi:hypothetical protein
MLHAAILANPTPVNSTYQYMRLVFVTSLPDHSDDATAELIRLTSQTFIILFQDFWLAVVKQELYIGLSSAGTYAKVNGSRRR